MSGESTEYAGRLAAELVALREACATHLRYIEGEVVIGLRDGRHPREVAANIAEQQAQNLRKAVERTGPLSLVDGTAGSWFDLPSQPPASTEGSE